MLKLKKKRLRFCQVVLGNVERKKAQNSGKAIAYGMEL